MAVVAEAVPLLDGLAAERFALRARVVARAGSRFDADEALALVTEAGQTQVASLGGRPDGAGMIETETEMLPAKIRKDRTISPTGTRASAGSSPAIRWWSMSKASRARSICCWRWRARRRSISRKSPCSRSPSNISPSSPRRAALRLEIAADYLVMAAWLAFLKSKLLLPAETSKEGEPTGEELAALLAFRLQRLHAMREAAAQLMTRKRLGRDVFARGTAGADPYHRDSAIRRQCLRSAQGLFAAAPAHRGQSAWRMPPRTVWSIKEARGELERLLGMNVDWAPLDQLLAEFLYEPELRKTALASSFTATLEMTREGRLEIRQAKSFAPLLIRRRERAA